MTAEDIIDRFSRRSGEPDRKISTLLSTLEGAVNDLIAEHPNWSWARVHLDPIAKTATGVRAYPLPQDFGLNFVPGAGEDGSHFVVKLSDGSNDSDLEYEPQASFFDRDFEGASNAKPARYTIVFTPGFKAEIHLDPPPDSNSDSHYELRGVYEIREFRLRRKDDWLPTVLGQYLLYVLLREYAPDAGNWMERFVAARTGLYVEEARNESVRLTPATGNIAGVNEWSTHLG